MSTSAAAPATSVDFDQIYQSPLLHWMWSDTRIPAELQHLVATTNPRTSLELGCGLGRFSTYLAAQGIAATGVDFSAVAIAKARQRTAQAARQPTFVVGDVTQLDELTTPFDVAVDVGCFHCLPQAAQEKYTQEAARLVKPGATLLLWALDRSPSELVLSPAAISQRFASGFELQRTTFSRRRVLASHWYWLVRHEGVVAGGR